MGFNSTPVVNMAGKIIGLIPTNFIIVLVENHSWYEHELTEDKHEVTSYYKTHMTREYSKALSQRSSSVADPDSPTNKGFLRNVNKRFDAVTKSEAELKLAKLESGFDGNLNPSHNAGSDNASLSSDEKEIEIEPPEIANGY